MNGEVVWHELEGGSYAADLPVWRKLADEAGSPVLDLGCGTGRVALSLARAGHRVVGIDQDPALIAELNRRAAEQQLPTEGVEGDVLEALDGDLEGRFGLAIAPMQLINLVPGRSARARLLTSIVRALKPDGVAALALLAQGDVATPEDGTPPLPDVGEDAGYVYSSLPVEVVDEEDGIRVRRLRQVVSPSGELTEEVDDQLLHHLSADQLEAEAAGLGLAAVERIEVPATPDHVGSTVVVLRI